MDNQIVLGGQIAKLGQTRYSPAGVPITRFMLDHCSQQQEAGFAREARCRIAVTVAGEPLVRTAAKLSVGAEVRISGFLARADNRQGVARLVLHAEHIEILASELRG